MKREIRLLLVATVLGVALGLVAASVIQKAEASPLRFLKSAATGVTSSSSSVTTEVLVLNSAATALPQTYSTKGRKAMEIYNNGPNAIWCAFTSGTAVINKSRPIASGGSWALDAPSNVLVYCKAATADQVTGAATVVSELFDD